MENKNEKLCKRLRFLSGSGHETIILGLVLADEEHFLRFRTARREYWVAKDRIILLEDTDQVWRGD